MIVFGQRVEGSQIGRRKPFPVPVKHSDGIFDTSIGQIGRASQAGAPRGGQNAPVGQQGRIGPRTGDEAISIRLSVGKKQK